MKRVKDISELKAGDSIIRVIAGRLEQLEYFGPLRTNSEYSIFLNERFDGSPKFYNNRLTYENWYLFTNSKDDWIQIYNLMIEYHKSSIKNLKKWIKPLCTSAKPSTL